MAWNFATPIRRKTHWRCIDQEAVLEYVAHNPPDNISDLSVADFKAWGISVQNRFQSQDTCEQQRFKRLPAELRSMHRNISTCSNERERHKLQHEAFKHRKRLWEIGKNDLLCSRIKSGGVVSKSSKLHKVQAVSHNGIYLYGEPAAELINQDFKQKWGGKSMQKICMMHEWLENIGPVPVCITSAELVHAWTVVRNIRKVGGDGLCLAVIKLFSTVYPKLVYSILGKLLVSPKCCEKELVFGRVFGKESVRPPASECRAILPLPALLTLADIILSTRVNKWVVAHMSPPTVCFIGARPKNAMLRHCPFSPTCC